MSHLKAQTEMTSSGLLTFEPQCEDIMQLFPTLNVLHMISNLSVLSKIVEMAE